MDDDYDPMAGDPEQDEGEDGFVQDGPDLFGAEPSPVVVAAEIAESEGDEDTADSADEDHGPAPLDEPTPSDDVDDQTDEDAPEDTLLIGPETPAEPDGLESEEDEDIEDDGTPDPAAQLEAAEELTEADPGAGRPDGPDQPTDTGSGPATAMQPTVGIRPGDQDPDEPPLALYRRYRPDTFDEVIGQEHVTEPLKRAIINNRVNHAYLFSGPRGCGKTTSARILARALNCEKGPTPNPCGVCQSCRDLARGGPGSIDVIEIDAASHGGVEDARDLRERAFFSPVSSRYKIYIIDEAHMVTTQGFNALLKLVEEPPPHVKFIFATTEPEKVIGTIRSRTHHYPFRLVPPKILIGYLRTICDKEGIHVDPAVLPLVVRAGGGSVRDSLSVLDQLLGGAEVDGVSYQRAAALLGYTPDALLDEIVDAFAAGDAHEVFATIDKVIEIGQDPRRFTEDLLRRIRDLVILSAVPDACSTGLIDASPEQATRLSHQAAGMGSGELTRAAEVLATGLTQMRGTTAPRLHLELMCSRVLLPGSDSGDRGYNARLERLERRVGIAGAAPSEQPAPSQPTPSQWSPSPQPIGEAAGRPDPRTAPQQPASRQPGRDTPARSPQQPAAPQPGPSQSGPLREPGPSQSGPSRESGASQPAPSQQPASQPVSSRKPAAPQPGPSQAGPSQQPGSPQPPASPQPDPQRRAASHMGRRRPRPSERDYRSSPAQQAPEPPVGGPSESTPQQPAGGPGPAIRQPATGRPAEDSGAQSGPAPSSTPQVDIAMLRREWPRVLDVVKSHGRVIWMVLSQYAQVLQVHDQEVTIGFANPGARDMFASGPHSQALHDAVVEVLGADLEFTPVLGGPGDGRSPDSQSPGPSNGPGPSSGPGPSREGPPDPSEPGRDGAVRPGAGEPDGIEHAPGHPGSGDAVTATHRWTVRAKEGIRPMSHRVEEPPSEEEVPPAEWDSEVVETPQVSAAELIRTELGGVVINSPVIE